MYGLERRITLSTPDRLRCSSTWPCQSQNATGAPGTAPTEDSFTIRRTPAAAAASIAAVSHATRRGSSAQERTSSSTPSSAVRNDAGSAKSPTASATASPNRV